jgi:hypothetical protein
MKYLEVQLVVISLEAAGKKYRLISVPVGQTFASEILSLRSKSAPILKELI